MKTIRPFILDFKEGVEDEENGMWQLVHPDFKIKRIEVCGFGLGQETIGMLEYEDGVFEVGVGESLRPYISLYTGRDPSEASVNFVREIVRLAWGKEIG